MVRCADCGFTYVSNPRADTADHAQVTDVRDPGDRRRYHHILRLLRRRLMGKADARVVEVGCGFGGLGVLLARHFRYVAVEPSPTTARFAARRGLDVRQQLFCPDPEFAHADAVIFDNVLEHVVDPLTLLHHAHTTLREGGLVVVIVPNRDDVRQLLPGWRNANHWIPPDHINYFTRRHLRGLLVASSFTNVRGFGFEPLACADWRYWPRAALELISLHPFGLNVWATK